MTQGFLVHRAPRMPVRDSFLGRMSPLAASATLHFVAGVVLLVIAAHGGRSPAAPRPKMPAETLQPQAARIVFLPSASAWSGSGGGGGGGGNRQTGPIRRAERPGRDRRTVPVAKQPRTAEPVRESPHLVDAPPAAQELVLDARPLASGSIDQIGLLEGGVGFGNSLGPGSGGGVGDGIGTGVGSGRGPGVGPGSDGGTGGGVYRPGGSVTPPTILSEVRPAYTAEALRRRIQGIVILEVIVRGDGRPTDARVIRSLDPDGLDVEAVRSIEQWRFEPGRLAGKPVDVLVIIELQFSIH
jgi:periplasmic protein TonB